MLSVLLLVLLLAVLFGSLGYAVSPLFFVLLVAVLLLLSGGVLWIDGLALRDLIPEAAREAFLFRWIRALALTSLGLLTFLLISARARAGRHTTG